MELIYNWTHYGKKTIKTSRNGCLLLKIVCVVAWCRLVFISFTFYCIFLVTVGLLILPYTLQKIRQGCKHKHQKNFIQFLGSLELVKITVITVSAPKNQRKSWNKLKFNRKLWFSYRNPFLISFQGKKLPIFVFPPFQKSNDHSTITESSIISIWNKKTRKKRQEKPGFGYNK